MTLDEALTAMLAALEPLTAEIPGLQITQWRPNPTPPAIDIYPDTPFQVGAGFGVGSKRVSWIVRCRVSTADPDSASETLLRLMDVNDAASVEAALAAADVIVGNEGTVSGFSTYADDPSGELLGFQMQVEMFV